MYNGINGINHLKDGANILTKPAAKICNICISSGLFPSDCKIAKLKPLYKKGSKTNPENFRPISLLPLISKVIERIVYDQVDNFLLQNNILYNYQSGFRKKTFQRPLSLFPQWQNTKRFR